MANPRQRRKARSSSHKPVSHSKHARRNLKKMPPIRAPKVLQDAWDKKKTVRQNYAALGLIHDLNPSAAGGAEIIDVDAAQADQGTSTTASLPAGMSSPPITENQSVGPCDSTETTSAPPPQGNAIPKGHGRIIRDQTGNILRIELPEEEQSSTQPAEDVEMDMEQLESGLEGSVKETWIKGMGMQTGRAKAVALREDVVDELDKLSTLRAGTLTAPLSGVGQRFTAQGERDYLEKLVGKYGSDVERMARDRKLNPEQRTEGELRRALRRARLLE